jgi:hypothetical protein
MIITHQLLSHFYKKEEMKTCTTEFIAGIISILTELLMGCGAVKDRTIGSGAEEIIGHQIEHTIEDAIMGTTVG